MRTIIRALCVLGLLVLASLGLMCTPTDQVKAKSVEDAIKSCLSEEAFVVCQAAIVAECHARPCTDEEQTAASAKCWETCFTAYDAAHAGGTHG
jgi:hypothetical protein